MKKWQAIRIGLGMALSVWTGCAATVGTHGGIYVPKDAAAQCVDQCRNAGMLLNSMVVMANTVGCVCSPANAPATACNAAGAAGGVAAIMEEEQQHHSAAAHASVAH